MDNYFNVIYKRTNLQYDYKLVKYLIDRFDIKTGSKLLDVGCGYGKHLHHFRQEGIEGYGLDIRYHGRYIQKCDVSTDRFPYEDEYFDFIFSKSLLEHIQNPDNFIQESYRILKKGGTIIILVPDWKSQLKHYWDDYTHCHAWTYKSLKDFLLINNFKNVGCEYFYQLPFVWECRYLKFIPKTISILPDRLKWKTKDMRNGEDRKLIRFSKELMLLGWGRK